jgi:hypothetical protein
MSDDWAEVGTAQSTENAVGLLLRLSHRCGSMEALTPPSTPPWDRSSNSTGAGSCATLASTSPKIRTVSSTL